MRPKTRVLTYPLTFVTRSLWITSYWNLKVLGSRTRVAGFLWPIAITGLLSFGILLVRPEASLWLQNGMWWILNVIGG